MRNRDKMNRFDITENANGKMKLKKKLNKICYEM